MKIYIIEYREHHIIREDRPLGLSIMLVQTLTVNEAGDRFKK